MREFTLDLDYGIKIVKNLRCTWIQRMTMKPGFQLCYEDDIYEKGVIYRSQNKELLIELQSKMIDAYKEGKSKVRL